MPTPCLPGPVILPAALLSVRQVAAILGVSTATVYDLVAAGQLPHLRVSNAIRVRPDDIEAFVGRR